MENQKIILISLDAISNLDFEIIKDLPNFSRLINNSGYCSNVTSVYPSLTFPAHASIVTGCYPKNHGIVNNHIFDPFAEIPVWYHYDSALKRKTLWDYFEEQDKKVLSLSWPVSAGGNISYSLPEMSPAKPKKWGPVNFFRQLGLWFNFGSKRLMFKALFSSPGFTKSWFLGEQPLLDRSMIKLLKQSLSDYNYNLLLFHIYGMDDAKHIYGTDSPEAEKYLTIYDELLGHLMAYTNLQNKRGDHVTLMITGDHSQKNVSKGIYLNHLLEDLGLCHTEDNKLVWWKAFFHSGDGMAYLYINENEDEQKIISLVSEKLKEIPELKIIFEKNQLAELGCDTTAALAVDAKDGYTIVDTFSNAEQLHNYIGTTTYKAVHGYLPFDPDYRTLFFAYGKGIKAGQIEEMSIIDIAPTICELQNVRHDGMDGRALNEILL